MAYSLDPSTDKCYEGTTCLVNKFDIRDEYNDINNLHPFREAIVKIDFQK